MSARDQKTHRGNDRPGQSQNRRQKGTGPGAEKSSKPADKPQADPVRQAVLYALEDLEQGETPELPGLTGRDLSFAQFLLNGVLRNDARLDRVAARLLSRPLPGKAISARVALRMGLFQLLASNVPDHAAVDGTVSLMTGRNRAPYRALVNGVLRSAIRERPRLETLYPETVQKLPRWLEKRWRAAWGSETYRDILKALETDPPLDLTFKTTALRDAFLTAVSDQAGSDADETSDRTAEPCGSLQARVFHAGLVTELPGYEDGHWWVQDRAAALPAQLAGEVSGRKVLDLCAAPGGKTMQLAAAGAQVAALDVSGTRLKRVSENLDRTGLKAELIEADALDWQPDEPFDVILLDAPCSATGTIRRHPELPKLRDGYTIEMNIPLQQRLLAQAAAWLKPGGLLIYAVCSMEPAEGEAMASTLPEGLELQPLVADNPAGITDELITDGCLRTLPSHGMDGFFALVARKV